MKFLILRAAATVPALIDARPRNTKRTRRQFQLLKHTDVEVLYSKHYAIKKEELDWLGARLEVLRGIVEKVCADRLAEPH